MRDDPFVTHRAQTESVTFLGNQSENTRNLYAIPGLDCVAHEGIQSEFLRGSRIQNYIRLYILITFQFCLQ